jgi:uncharacterized membrane protein YphA (DoxX/SURF4 family)
MTLDPVVLLGLRLALALLFLSAAAHKLRDLVGFRRVLSAYQVLPEGLVPGAAIALAGFESTVGAGLLLGVVPVAADAFVAAADVLNDTRASGVFRGSALLGACLLLLYAAAIAFNLARGRRSIDCGCGGPGGERPIGAMLVARNVCLVVLLGLSVVPAAGRPVFWLDAVTVTAVVAASALLYAAGDVAAANAARQQAPRRPAWSTP